MALDPLRSAAARRVDPKRDPALDTSAAAIRSSVVVNGHSGFMIVPIAAIPAATFAAFTYYREHLPSFCLENAEKIIAASGLLTLVLIVAALFMRSRRVEVQGDRLYYHSWFTDRKVRIESVTAVTFETEISGGDDRTLTEHFLTLWSGDDVAMRFNVQRWPRDGLRQLLRTLRERRPAIRFDLAVDRYIGA